MRISKSEQAYERIKGMILDNTLTGGTVYSENQLTAMLGMSRTPIRDAVKALESEGYAEVYHGVGFRVRAVTVKEMYELYPLRYLLESYAMRCAMGRIPAERYDALIAGWAALRERVQSGADIPQTELERMDKATHDLFIDHSGNGTLRQLIDLLESKIQRFRMMSTRMNNDSLDTVDQHIAILTHMKRGELDTSLRLMQRHIHRPWEQLFTEAGFADFSAAKRCLSTG